MIQIPSYLYWTHSRSKQTPAKAANPLSLMGLTGAHFLGYNDGLDYFLAAIGLAACAGLLILTTPFLANYFVMNLALFLVLFVFGFFTARRAGVTFWMQIGMLAIFVFVGLDPQQPVATQTIIDAYVGFIVGMGIATIVGRLIWPVLPQMVMRDNLLAIFTHTKALLDGDADGEKIQTQLAILPLEALHASGQIRIAGCTEDEKARLGALIRALQTLATRTTVLVSRKHILPEIAQAILRPRLERLEVEFKQMLDAFAKCLRQGDCRRELPSLRRALTEMDEAFESIDQGELFKGKQLEAPVAAGPTISSNVSPLTLMPISA